MGSLRLRARQRATLRKYPIVGILELCAFIAFVLGVLYLLEQYSAGKIVNRVLVTLHMGDWAPKVLLEDGLDPWLIIALLILASAINVFIDDFVVKRRSWILRGIEWLAKFVGAQLQAIGTFIKRGWVRLCDYLGYNSEFAPQVEAEKESKTSKALSYPFKKAKAFMNEMNNIRKNPSKGGLIAIFVCAVTPKFIPGLPGTVALGVLIIRCNSFGWKGWAVLSAAVLLRIVCVVLYWKSMA